MPHASSHIYSKEQETQWTQPSNTKTQSQRILVKISCSLYLQISLWHTVKLTVPNVKRFSTIAFFKSQQNTGKTTSSNETLIIHVIKD